MSPHGTTDDTTLIILHKSWSSALDRCDKEGKVLSSDAVSGEIEPLVEGAPTRPAFPVPISSCDLFARAVAAAIGKADKALPMAVAPSGLLKAIQPFLSQGGAPYCEGDWDLIRGSLRGKQLTIVEEKEFPTREHFRIRLGQSAQWRSHLLFPDGERIDLAGVIQPGSYTKEDKDKGQVIIPVPVTDALLQVAALQKSLQAASTRSSRICLVTDSALNGALRVAWRDWEKALGGPLSQSVGAAYPWLPAALEEIRLGVDRTYTVHWSLVPL